MVAYYNEFDTDAAEWLSNLCTEKHITPGKIDTRSITDVQADDLTGHGRCHFFAGIGGWDLALQFAGWPEDREVWTGSCPCQPFSGAGKGLAEKDERHLWPEFRRLIAECRPATIFGEQVASPLGRKWLSGVFVDLENLGYAVAGADLCAASVGTPHIRQRLFWVADRDCSVGRRRRVQRQNKSSCESEVASLTRPSGCCSVSGIPDAEGEQRKKRDANTTRSVERTEAEGDAKRFGHSSAANRLANSNGERHGSIRVSDVDTRQLATSGEFDFIPCLDGKTRRTQSGLHPLAYGIPAKMAELRARLPGVDISAARAFRRIALKGMGNAIVPQVAAEFIKAFLETE